MQLLRTRQHQTIGGPGFKRRERPGVRRAIWRGLQGGGSGSPFHSTPNPVSGVFTLSFLEGEGAAVCLATRTVQWGRDVSEVVPALAIHSILQIKPAWKVNISCPRDKEASQAGRFVTLCLAEKLQSMMTAL